MTGPPVTGTSPLIHHFGRRVTVSILLLTLLAGLQALKPSTVQDPPVVAGSAAAPRGQVWAWGSNTSGQIGSGTYDYQPGAVRVRELSTIVQVSAGTLHSLALDTDGAIWAWGANNNGQLGDGTQTYSPAPSLIETPKRISSIASGEQHNLALTNDGEVLAWGFNGAGQITRVWDPRVVLQPVLVEEVPPSQAVAAGPSFSLALTSGGEVWSWGNSSYGVLGHQSSVDQPSPITGLPPIAAIAAGKQHCLAVARDGSVWAWGSNEAGQLGDGTIARRKTPLRIGGLANVTSVAAGAYHSLALTSDGAVWAWGRHGARSLGTGALSDSPLESLEPVLIPLPGPATSIAASTGESLVVLADGTVWGWSAYLAFGPLGQSRLPNFPVRVSSMEHASSVALGTSHALAVEAAPRPGARP